MNEQYIDAIHRYLNGAMDVAESEDFEAEIRRNPALKNDVEVERTLLAGLEHAAGKALRKTIGSVHQNLKAEGFFRTNSTEPSLSIVHVSKSSVMKRILAIAAALAVVAAGIYFFMQPNKPADPNAVFAKFYQPQDDVQRAQKIIASLESYGMAGVQTDSDTLKQALQLYESGKYQESIALLKSFSAQHPENETAVYYLGVIHMSQEHYAKAIELLLPLSRAEGSSLKNDALWNLGLCLLKTDNGREDARDAFLKLSKDNSYPNQRGAVAVLEQLFPD